MQALKRERAMESRTGSCSYSHSYGYHSRSRRTAERPRPRPRWCTVSALEIERCIALHPFSSMGIGGPAKFLLRAKKAEDILEAARFAQREQLDVLVIGRGSNCLFDDRGYNGLVIVNEIDFLDDVQTCKGVECMSFSVGAGYSFNTLGMKISRHGWSGLEFATGIPGTVGGAIYMNAGANGRDTASCIEKVEYITKCGQTHVLHNIATESFGYRESPFQHMDDFLAITSAEFKVYAKPEAGLKAKEFMLKRSESQPLKDFSAGCIFRNPGHGPSAGALIDRAGLKGFTIGTASVSQVHANFLINQKYSEHSSTNMQELIKYVKDRIRAENGVELIEEIRIIPYNE